MEPGNDYRTAMHRLVRAIQELALAQQIEQVQDIVRVAARELTGCDGATFVLRDGPYCFYVDEHAIAPLWKGKRFPLETCISGWAMRNKRPAVVPDIYADERIPHDAYRPTFVKSLVMVPIRSIDPVGAIGNYWAAPHEPTTEEVSLLSALADAASIAIENLRVRSEVERERSELQAALEDETRDLEALTSQVSTRIRDLAPSS